MGVRCISHKFRARIVAGDEPAWLKKHRRRLYIVQVALATPPWSNLAEIRRLNRRAAELSRRTKKSHVCDHVIPLTHKMVCGLNVPANIAITLRAVNARKGNRWGWNGLAGELFSEPEQFSLIR